MLIKKLQTDNTIAVSYDIIVLSTCVDNNRYEVVHKYIFADVKVKIAPGLKIWLYAIRDWKLQTNTALKKGLTSMSLEI